MIHRPGVEPPLLHEVIVKFLQIVFLPVHSLPVFWIQVKDELAFRRDADIRMGVEQGPQKSGTGAGPSEYEKERDLV
jgi:hypothetical protein